jgi:hypothetical protein
MARQIVLAALPIPINRPQGSTITFVNQDAANDMWFSGDRNELLGNGWLTNPQGLKVAKGGTVLQWPNFPGVVWVRSTADSGDLEVLP